MRLRPQYSLMTADGVCSLTTTAFRVPARDMCRLLQTALLPENLFVLMLPSRSHTATSMERFFRLQRRITSGSKTMTGQITDISKIAVRLMGFSYKKNCGRLPFGEVPAAVLFRFSFPTKPIRFLLFWRTVPFLQIGKCIVLMVSEFFFISVPVQRFLHGTCGRRRSARSTSSGYRK